MSQRSRLRKLSRSAPPLGPPFGRLRAGRASRPLRERKEKKRARPRAGLRGRIHPISRRHTIQNPQKDDPIQTVSSKKRATHRGWHSRGYLPHFDQGLTAQFITFRLHDSLPRAFLAKLRDDVSRLDKKEEANRHFFALAMLDVGHGDCRLRDPRVAAMVQDGLWRFDGERYRLVAWCVMPNHVHSLAVQCEGWPLSKVVHSWKSFTAHQANRILGRRGPFWAPDYFDRYIRDEAHMANVTRYIRDNPVKANLCENPADWPWSSAAYC